MSRWPRSDLRGFTLVEVLVAMTIVAVSLLAALRVATQGATHVGELRSRLLAGWIAADRLGEQSARGDWLPIGELAGVQQQAGVDFAWRERVSATPNAAFRRVDIYVYMAGQPTHYLAHSVGFAVNPTRTGR